MLDMKESFYNIPITIEKTDFVYNTFTGCLVKQNMLDEYVKGIGDITSEIVDFLTCSGFLVDDEDAEVEKVKTLRIQRKYSEKMYKLVINMTLDCNLKCWYCYENHSTKAYIDDRMITRILKHLDLKSMVSSFEVLELTLFGGEPLMNYRATKLLLEGVRKLAKSRGFKIKLFVVTNGTLVSKKYIELFSLFNVRFQVTIDGDKKMHDSIRAYKKTFMGKSSYQSIIDGLKLLNGANSDFYFTLRVNYDDLVLEKINTLLADLDFMDRRRTFFCLQQVWQTDEGKIGLESLWNAINKINQAGFMLSSMVFTHTYCSCEADNYNQAIINYDGKIFKCTARDFREEYHYGYLAESGLIVWDTQRLETRLALKFPAKCQACKLLPCCPGICSQKLLEHTNPDDISCPFPFDKGMTMEDVILFNVKQKMILKRYEKEHVDIGNAAD